MELILCSECGQEYAACELDTSEEGWTLVPRPTEERDEAEDYLDLVDEEDEEEQEKPRIGIPRLLTHATMPDTEHLQVRIENGRVVDESAPGVADYGAVGPDGRSQRLQCAECGQRETERRRLFRSFRGGASFFLRSIVPVLLDHAPALQGSPSRLPSEGRRVLTFTDSRQGTARFALDAQLDSERNYARSALLHKVADRRKSQQPNTDELERLEKQVADLEAAVKAAPGLQSVLDDKRHELEEAQTPAVGRLTWTEAVSRLSEEEEVDRWMPRHWEH